MLFKTVKLEIAKLTNTNWGCLPQTPRIFLKRWCSFVNSLYKWKCISQLKLNGHSAFSETDVGSKEDNNTQYQRNFTLATEPEVDVSADQSKYEGEFKQHQEAAVACWGNGSLLAFDQWFGRCPFNFSIHRLIYHDVITEYHVWLASGSLLNHNFG